MARLGSAKAEERASGNSMANTRENDATACFERACASDELYNKIAQAAVRAPRYLVVARKNSTDRYVLRGANHVVGSAGLIRRAYDYCYSPHRNCGGVGWPLAVILSSRIEHVAFRVRL